jgi:hypothetical protein
MQLPGLAGIEADVTGGNFCRSPDCRGVRILKYNIPGAQDEPDNHDINMEEQHGYLDYRIVPGHIGGEWDEYNGNEEYDIDPENIRINGADEMELAMMTQPEASKNEKGGNRDKDLRNKAKNLTRKQGLSLGDYKSGWIKTQGEEGRCDRTDPANHRLQLVL